jgi:alanine racemase
MLSRRRFLSATGAGFAGVAAANQARALPPAQVRATHDPWLEVSADALRHNVREIARLAEGRPVLAVVKNNAYGLGLGVVGPILDGAPEVSGLAVVKAGEALTLRAAGVRKPILVMGAVSDDEAEELVRSDVRLAPFDDNADARLDAIARRAGRAVHVHLDIDTGMNRVGMPVERALQWSAKLVANPRITVDGAYTTFTEDDAFDAEQLARFTRFAEAARGQGIALGTVHAASSHALFFRRAALLELVRPGLALYGAYPAGARPLSLAQLRPAFRLRARVVRVEQLEAGEGVSYGRNYIAERPVWIATLPVGHADGYPRRAVEGCEVLIGERTYPVIGAVSASHTIIEVGDEARVAVGDVATLVGWEHPAVHPNTVSERAEISVYDVLMHLSARLPVTDDG